MKHYGLKRKDSGGWLITKDGLIYWTTSQIIAYEQMQLILMPDDWFVCEFKNEFNPIQKPEPIG